MDSTKEAVPERCRANLSLRIIPEENAQDIRLRYVQNIATLTYAALRERVYADCSSDCKGLGGCKSGDNGCAAKNSCKGKGGCAVPVKEA